MIDIKICFEYNDINKKYLYKRGELLVLKELTNIKMDYSELEKKLEYEFKNKDLLRTALTHTSYAYEHKVQSNEKLEFLGDSILEFLSSIYLYENYSNLREGEMTKVRAQVVCEASLYKVARNTWF